MPEQLSNPADPEQSLKRPLNEEQLAEAHPPLPSFILEENSAVTKAEKVESNGVNVKGKILDTAEPAAKRVKMGEPVEGLAENGHEKKKIDSRDKVKGIALVKPEYVDPLLLQGHY
jgi:tRNA-dihydrouridine synthase 3